MKRIKSISSMAMCLVFSVISVQPTAAVSVTPYSCLDMGWHYRTYNKTQIFIPTGKKYTSGPGGTVTASIQGTQTVSSEINASFTFSASAVVATASTTFGASFGLSTSISESYSYTHIVNSGKYGNLQFGNHGYKYTFEKYYLNNLCQKTSSNIGLVLRMPTSDHWGYRYWETNS
jgi:opacity protein-like surface antigen